MASKKNSTEIRARLRNLYPDLSDNELAQVEEKLRQYVAVGIRMYERIQRDPEAYAKFKALLTLQQ